MYILSPLSTFSCGRNEKRKSIFNSFRGSSRRSSFRDTSKEKRKKININRSEQTLTGIWLDRKIVIKISYPPSDLKYIFFIYPLFNTALEKNTFVKFLPYPKLVYGEGRAIPLKQGFLYKKSSGGLGREWRERYVVLTGRGNLVYYPSLSAYLQVQ